MEENKLTPELLDNIKDGDLSKVSKDVLLELYKIIRHSQNHDNFVKRCIENETTFLNLLGNTEQFSTYGKILSENLKDTEDILTSNDIIFLSKIANTPKPNDNSVSFVRPVMKKAPTKVIDDDFEGDFLGEIELKLSRDTIDDVYIRSNIFDFIINDLYKNRAQDLDTEYEVKSFKDILSIPAGISLINDKMFSNYHRGQISYLIISDNLRGLNTDIFNGLQYIYAPKNVLPDNSILCIASNNVDVVFSLDILATKVMLINPAGKEFSKVRNSIFAYKLHNPNYIGLLTIKN